MGRVRITDVQRRHRIARRHGLDPAHRFADVVAATRGMTALHATDQATIYASLAARVGGVTVADIDRALYDDRSVVKQMAMRRTLFVVDRVLLPAVVGSASARVSVQHRPRLVKDLVAAGLDGERWLHTAERDILDLLADGHEYTTRELRDALPHVAAQVRTNIGKKYEAVVSFAPRVLVQLNVDGLVARGHNDGHWRLSRPRWTTMTAWLGEAVTPADARAGYAELVAGWLRTFGPGTVDDMRWWLGATVGVVTQALDDTDAMQVDLDDGVTGWVLADDIGEDDPPHDWAALLPVLDPTVMGWKRRDVYLDSAMVPDLFDTVGNAGNTAWWCGRVVGTWIQDDGGRVHVAPHPLADLSPAATAALRAEADRLTAWFDGAIVNTVWASPAMQRARAIVAGA